MTRPHRLPRSAALALLALLGACGDELESGELAPLGDYTLWHRVDTVGPLQAHGDTYRILYANDVARSWPGAGAYPVGSVVVKEIFELTEDGGPGELDYIAIARKLDEAPAGGDLHDGWLWTFAGDRDDVGTTEQSSDSCWETCHVSSPYGGLFHHFGR